MHKETFYRILHSNRIIDLEMKYSIHTPVKRGGQGRLCPFVPTKAIPPTTLKVQNKRGFLIGRGSEKIPKFKTRRVKKTLEIDKRF